eukprot:gb/GECG01005740.1/.p1 GENE.gb/GECG01005740.1/~~gb/GECG01005740.1/.p1  ORF type:complete len:922 (+),score=118.09 gb/GECG01005740.1/:1-2766(+)
MMLRTSMRLRRILTTCQRVGGSHVGRYEARGLIRSLSGQLVFHSRPKGRQSLSTTSSVAERGVALSVVGDRITIKNMNTGRVGNVVRFESGAEAFITEVLDNGESHAIHCSGNRPHASELCWVAHDLPHISISNSKLGRILSPSGDTLDVHGGTGVGSDSAVHWPLLSSSCQKFHDRELARNSGVFFTQNHVADVFHPLVRGSATLVTVDENLDIGEYINELCQGITDNQSAHLIYAAVGRSESKTISVLEQFSKHHERNQFTAVVAPDSSSLGEQYLCPFSAAALGEYLRSQGRHAVIVYDNLTRHFEIARQCVNLDWNKILATPSHHGFLFDSCYKSKETEGSMTAIALAEGSPQEGAGVPTAEAAVAQMSQQRSARGGMHIPSMASSKGADGHDIASIKRRGYLSLLVSLAQDTYHVGQVNTEGDWRSYDEDALLHRMGTASTGPSYHKYANRAIHLFRQLRLLARDSAQAYSHGIEFEADLDQLLAFYLKAKVVMLQQGLPDGYSFSSDYEAAEYTLSSMLQEEKSFPQDVVDPNPKTNYLTGNARPGIGGISAREIHTSACMFSQSNEDEGDNKAPDIPTSPEFENRMKKLEEKLDPAQKQAFAHVRAKKEKERRKRFNKIPVASKSETKQNRGSTRPRSVGSENDDHSPFSSDSPFSVDSDSESMERQQERTRDADRQSDEEDNESSSERSDAKDKSTTATSTAEERKLKILRMKAEREARRRPGSEGESHRVSERKEDAGEATWISRFHDILSRPSFQISERFLDAQRRESPLFAMLFSLTHGYCRAIPTSKINEYARGLASTLSVCPAPEGTASDSLLTEVMELSGEDGGVSFEQIDASKVAKHSPFSWDKLRMMDERNAVKWLLSSDIVRSAELNDTEISKLPSFWRAYHEVVRAFTVHFLLEHARGENPTS